MVIFPADMGLGAKALIVGNHFVVEMTVYGLFAALLSTAPARAGYLRAKQAIREGRVNLRDSYGRVEQGEVFLYNVHISPYSHRGYADHEPVRRRKLLLHKREIRKLIGKVVERGMTLVPVRMYFKRGRVKVAVSLAKGKRVHDKRETLRRREADREARAAIKYQ